MTPKPATTTMEQDRASAGRRRINAIWESTQAVIALAVTICTLGVAALTVYRQESGGRESFIFLTNVFFVVIGFYFGRTNHDRSGGIGGHRAGRRGL